MFIGNFPLYSYSVVLDASSLKYTILCHDMTVVRLFMDLSRLGSVYVGT